MGVMIESHINEGEFHTLLAQSCAMKAIYTDIFL